MLVDKEGLPRELIRMGPRGDWVICKRLRGKQTVAVGIASGCIARKKARREAPDAARAADQLAAQKLAADKAAADAADKLAAEELIQGLKNKVQRLLL